MTTARILHLYFGKEGGTERFLINLVRGFAERGVEQRFVIRPNRSWHDQVAVLGPVIENNYRRISLSGQMLTWRIRRMVREWRPDVIMSWMDRASRLTPNDARSLRVTRLGDFPASLENMRHIDCIVSNMPRIAERCRELGWTRQLAVISNFPPEVTPVAIDRASLDTPADAFVISSSGRFVPRKGFDTLVRAAAKIPDAWLWLIGEGKEQPRLEALVAELRIGARTRFTGWVDEPIHHVAASDVFVMPSRHEPLGNVVLESWQAGVPTVSSRSEGPLWFVADGVDALLFDVDDVDALATAIRRVRAEPDLRRSLVENGRAKLAARFSKQRVVDQYLELFARARSP